MACHAALFKRLITVALLVCTSCAAQAGKILIAPTPHGKSHMMNLKKIAKEVELRGHSVMWVAMASDVPFLQPLNGTLVSYAIHGMSYDTPIPEFRIMANTPWKEVFQDLSEVMAGACMGLMSNQTALDRMKEYEADVMIAEMFEPCSALLAHTLNLPWINHWPVSPMEPFATSLWPGSNRRLFQPNPLSYYPQFRSESSGPTTQHMSLWQRLENFAVYWSSVWDDWRTHSDLIQRLYKQYNFNPALPEQHRRMVLSIVPADWAAEWLRPVSPNHKLVGPILSEPGKPLPPHLEEFMSEAGEQGVLLASLGTIAELNQQQLRGMAAAFAALPCRVLWKLTAKEVPDAAATAALQLGNNTQVLTWVPQNDILAHPNLRAFLSHVGINSMYEAIYHGKPVVAMPIFADQTANADKVVGKGFGVRVSPMQAGTPAFKDAIMEVLSNPQYTATAEAMSVKIKARKNTPVQEAADWIEHVIDTRGDPYMNLPEDELSFAVRNLLDVYAIFAACCCILALAAKAVLQLLLSRCRPVLKA